MDNRRGLISVVGRPSSKKNRHMVAYGENEVRYLNSVQVTVLDMSLSVYDYRVLFVFVWVFPPSPPKRTRYPHPVRRGAQQVHPRADGTAYSVAGIVRRSVGPYTYTVRYV